MDGACRGVGAEQGPCAAGKPGVGGRATDRTGCTASRATKGSVEVQLDWLLSGLSAQVKVFTQEEEVGTP